MTLDRELRRFPTREAALAAAHRLDLHGIACRVSSDPVALAESLYVAQDQADAAEALLGGCGVKACPPPVPEPLSSEPDDPFLAQVSGELKAQADKQRSIWSKIGTLLLTLVLFVSMGLFRDSLSGVAMIVLVILIHELGHFAAMKLLRYTDVQMFFIPMFGAAVAGKETAPSGAKKAIVSLMGPAPGIFIGIAAGVLYFVTRQPLLAEAARTFLFLNTFNLLPLHPLDGGHVFDALLFSRHPKLEVAFKVLTTLALGLLALAIHARFMGILAFFVFMSIRATHLTATVAQSLRKEIGTPEDSASPVVPPKLLPLLVERIRARMPLQQATAKIVAMHAMTVWQRLRNKPCRIMPLIGLLTCYVFCVVLGLASIILFEAGNYLIEKNKNQPQEASGQHPVCGDSHTAS